MKGERDRERKKEKESETERQTIDRKTQRQMLIETDRQTGIIYNPEK